MKQKTDAEYISAPNRCPFCNSLNIEGTGAVEADGDWMTNAVLCQDCEKTWDDMFTLGGYCQT